ncbi:MAG: iron-containing alcohol dehydrogenase [Chloroflexi bacterium]|nr:iron-containing alcohol dehydrogenase [Chloroflexota bacterium]
MRFEFATSNRILFGPGTVAEVPKLAQALGHRAFVLYDPPRLAHTLIGQLTAKGLTPLPYPVRGEPTVQSVLEAIRAAREGACDLVIGIGGGSTLDTGKAVAVLLTNPGNLHDYLEVVGAGRFFENPSAPYIAIPTTAGTGSEVTRNAVIAIPEQHLKVSLRSPYMLPRYAVVDPELTYSLPPEITASTGLDALTQVIEPFVCNTPTPLTDLVCRDGITRAVRALLPSYRNGQDITAREDMSLASMFGGMALANARLGAVHGLAGPIGGMISAPHGAICARLLPIVMEANLNSLHSLQSDSPAIDRYQEVARLLTGDGTADTEDGIAWVWNLCHAMNIRPLVEFGLKSDDFPVLVSQAQRASSMKGNPVSLTDGELTDMLEKAI